MSATQIYGLIMVSCIVILIALCIWVGVSKRRRIKQSKIIHYKRDKKVHSYFLYKLYLKTPLINRYFKKTINKLETIYPADRIAIISKATSNMTRSLGLVFGSMIVITLFSRGDIFFIGVGISLTYVLFAQTLTSSLEKIENKLDEQFSDFLTDVRHYYHDTLDVCDAVYATIENLPYEISLHINKIYAILNSTDAENEVTKYTDIAPNKFLMMFAAICATIKEYGDTKMENGQWLFINNMAYIKEELSIEILKKRKNAFLFSGLKAMTIIPIFLLKPIEWWATSNMPEMASFYSNGSGTIVMAITFAISIFCFQLISNLRDGHVDAMKENTLINKLQNLPIIRGILTAEINRNYSKSLRIGDNLKSVGDNIGPKGFFLKRILYGIALAIAFNVVVFFSQHLATESLLYDFTEEFENSIVPSDEYRQNMRIISQNYVGIVRRIDSYEDKRDVYVEKIVEEENIRKKYAEEIVDIVFARVTKLKSIYYKWYMAIGTVLAATFGFYIPYFLLWYQMSIMKMSMEDEVVQFQTLALILSNVSGITTNKLLEWMERFSFCFRSSISECIVNLEYSIQDSIKKMKDRESFPPFKRFCDNLLSIDNIGMVSAFDEIASEREYYKKKREQDNTELMTKKSSMGKIIAFIPLIFSVIGYMILPFLQMAMTMMEAMNNALTSV